MLRWRYIDLYFFAVTALASMSLVPLFRRLALRYKVLDHPSSRKLHREAMPLLGGGAIFCAFFGVVLVHYFIRRNIGEIGFLKDMLPSWVLSHLAGSGSFFSNLMIIFTGALAVSFVGLLDDIFDLPIRVRLLIETLVAVFVVSAGVQPSVDFLPQPLVWLLGVVWVLGVTNSFNLLDGADGLAAGVAMITALLMAWIMALGGQHLQAIWLCALAGAAAGFLRFNFPPAKIFMGSTGSMFLGYMLAVSVLMSTRIPLQHNLLFSILVPLLVMAMPLYDTFSVIAIRIAQGRSIVLADQSHFVHRLMHLGFSVRQAVMFIYLLTLCFGITAVVLVKGRAFTGVMLLVQALLFFSVLIVLERVMFTSEKTWERKTGRTRGGGNPTKEDAS